MSSPIPMPSHTGTKPWTPAEITQETKTLKKRLGDLGEVNVNAIEEYKRVKARYEYLTEQRDDLLKAKDDLTDLIQDLTRDHGAALHRGIRHHQ